jgi:hypothetical protein
MGFKSLSVVEGPLAPSKVGARWRYRNSAGFSWFFDGLVIVPYAHIAS